MMILIQDIGNYSQTLRILSEHNEVKVVVDGDTVYDGIAKRVIDEYNKLSFIDENNKKHEYIKRSMYYIS